MHFVLESAFNDINISSNGSNNWKVGQDTPIGFFRNLARPHDVPCGLPQGPEIFEECGYWEVDTNDPRYSHTNSSPASKLAHLLAQGDSNFRGSNYTPLHATLTTSVYATSRLMFHVMANLTPTASYCDFRTLVHNSALNATLGVLDLGPDITWDASALQKVYNALVAVNLSPDVDLRCDGEGDFPALCPTDNIDDCE